MNSNKIFMNEDLISEFIKECTKIFNEIKKKNNSEINKSLDSCMTNLISLKDKISTKNNNLISSIKLLSTESFIKAINHIIVLKYSKFFYNILIILKKYIEYNLYSKEKSSDIIIILKSFYDNPKINNECLKKILEIVQTYIFSDYFEIKYESLCIIYILLLKVFNMINQNKNKDFKNPIRLLFTTLTDKIYISENIFAINKITQLIVTWFKLCISENKENKNQEIINKDINEDIFNEILGIIKKRKNNIYIQCLSLELLSQGFSDLKCQKKDDKDNLENNELDNLIKTQILTSLLTNINKIKNNYSLSEDEHNYLNYIKICKFLKILLFNYNLNYDIIQSIIEIIKDKQNRQNKIFWKIYLSYELLTQVISNHDLLTKIYLYNKEYLNNIFLTLYDVFDEFNDMIKDINTNKNIKRNIYENKIYLEGDEIFIPKEENKKYYKNLINESVQILIESLIKINDLNKGFVDNEIFCIICGYVRDLIFKLFSNEFNNFKGAGFEIIKDSHNEFVKYINYLKSLIILYHKINNLQKENETIKLLCNLALDFSDNSNHNEEKNIFFALYLLDLMKEVKILNKDSFIILLQTIEVFNRKYNYLKLNEYIKKDIYKMINDMNINLKTKNKTIKKKSKIRIEIKIKDENDESNKNEIIEKIEIQKNNKKLEIKEEDKENTYKNKLCREINDLFLDKKIYNFESIKYIIDAICSCIDLSIQKMKDNFNKVDIFEKNDLNKDNKIINQNYDEKYNNFTFEINFYFSKILSLTLLYLDNIYILFEPFISVVNKLIDNKLMIEFSVDVLCAVIPEILLKYKNIKSSINKNINEENKIWINEKWQKVLFSPLLTLLSQPDLFSLLKPKIFIAIEKIIQKSGNYIDSYGWDSILQACTILSNYNKENTFIIIKEILNVYNGYLSIFNITPLMKLLKLFICEEKDKNINFSSIELFWSCAKIIDDYKQEKKVINDNEKLYFINSKKEKEIKIFCEDLFINLFSYLIEINTISNIDIRKSELNIFTEIFVSKMNSLSKDNCLKIIIDIFFKTFVTNSDKYISDNKNMETEKIVEISLLCIIKIIKEYLNENEKEYDIYELYINKIIELIPFCSNLLITDILKSLVEIKTSKNSNIPLIETKIENFFKILSLISSYLKGKNFSLDKNNKSKIYRLFKSILSYLNYIPDKEVYSNENIKTIFDILDSLLSHVCELESTLLKSKPRKILDLENDIFVFVEKIKIDKNFKFNYFFDKMNLDLKNPHSEAICRRSFEGINNLINIKIKAKTIFGIKTEEKDIICKYIEKIENIMKMRNNDEAIEFIFNSSTDKNNIKDEINFDKYLENFIKIINEICKNFFEIREDEKNMNEKNKNDIINNIYDIFSLILHLFELMFKQSITRYQTINQSYNFIINELYQKMDIVSANFIINKLLYYIFFIFGKENKDLYEKIENKIMHVIKLISDISYEYIINFGDTSYISLNQFFINELFKLCKYKTNEQIINEIKQFNIKINEEDYIQKYIKISKILTNLLIQKIIDILKKYREDEKKIGDMPLNRGRIYEIISLLNNIKDLEIYPYFNDLNKQGLLLEEQNENAIFYDAISKSKKMHLFYIQPILNDFIFSKENSIKSLIKEIFNEITNIINLPKLINFDESINK